MFSWAFDQVAAGFTVDEMNRHFPHPRASEGFRLLCIEHGIYGLAERGDNCGPCAARARAWGCKVCGAPAGEPCTKSCDDDSVPDERDAVNPNKESNVEKKLLEMIDVVGKLKIRSERGMLPLDIRVETRRSGEFRGTVFDMTVKSLLDVMREAAGCLGSTVVFHVTVSTMFFDVLERELQKVNPTLPQQLAQLGAEASVAMRDSKPTLAGKIALAAGLVGAHKISPAEYMKVLETGEIPAHCGPVRMCSICESPIGPLGSPCSVLDGQFAHPTCIEEDEYVVGPKWQVKRDETRDALVFTDPNNEYKSILIGYELIRQAARDFVLPREKTERGESLRSRILEAVGAASTLFQGKGGVFDDKRALEIAENLARDIELGPGLDSLPGIGRDLERQRNPEQEPLDHLDVDLLADDAKPGER